MKRGMEFAAPTRRTVPAVLSDTRGATTMEMENVEIYDATKTTPWERRFNPYDFNGGCVSRAILIAFALKKNKNTNDFPI